MNEEKVIQLLLEHSDAIKTLQETVVTRTEFNEFKNSVLNGQDKMIKILTRLDEERVFTNEAIKKIEKDLEEHKVIIAEHDRVLKRVKLQLNIA